VVPGMIATEGQPLDPRDPRPKQSWFRPPLRRRLGSVALRLAGRLLAQHAIALEYPPPDPNRERWGWGSPSNTALTELLAANVDTYRASIELIERYGPDLTGIPASDEGHAGPFWNQRWFTALDAAALYSFIRARAPAHYHEIGSGHSTLFAARAIRDAGLSTRVLSVDPRPRANVDLVCNEVIRTHLQEADTGRVAELGGGDILLIDSSHYVLKGSDVVVFFLDVLPALPPGVLVGVHDVFLPDDYAWWLSDRWYSEQYLIAAWLLGASEKIRVVLPIHYWATRRQTRAQLETLWETLGLPGIAYGSTLWFETS
jgi:Methyltransferase domain